MIKLGLELGKINSLVSRSIYLMANNNQYYNILGVQKSASSDQIKSAFRKLALKEHPDKGGDPQKFKTIAKAYDVLSNPDKRSLYDSGHDTDDMGFNPGNSNMNDIFNMFRGGAAHSNPVESIALEIQITLQQLYRGIKKKVQFYRNQICSPCQGKGAKNVQKCMRCNGAGTTVKRVPLGPGMFAQSMQVCFECKGNGQKYKQQDKCQKCNGKKVMKQSRQITVDFQPGFPSDENLIMEGEGNQHPKRMAGDLHIKQKLARHSIFQRRGADLYITKTISLLQALTGFSLEIKHLDGNKYWLQTNPGQVLSDNSSKMIKGLGMPFYKNSKKHGNLIIEFKIKYPSNNYFSKQDVQKLKQIFSKQKNQSTTVASENKEKSRIKILQNFKEQDLNPSPSGGKNNGGEQQNVRCASQ